MARLSGSVMNTQQVSTNYAVFIRGACIGIFGIILCAGLWPFHVPRNEATWLTGENGLLFGQHGSIVSSSGFPANDLDEDASCTLEIWLEPRVTNDIKTILSFEGSRGLKNPFSLRQSKDALEITRYNVDGEGTSRTAFFRVHGVFSKGRQVLATVTLDRKQTSVYVDGILARVSAITGVSNNNFSGRLVLANSTAVDDSWAGQVMGLAIYQKELTPSRVREHYESWMKDRRPSLTKGDSPVALYLFDERTGLTAHNHMDSTTDLNIPAHYFVLHPYVMRVPWREYKPTWSYWQDVAVNIVGFIPLGFCVVAYFASVRVINRPVITTMAIGFFTSLMIETLQIFLPTRSSGMTDIITNTLGTAVGMMLYLSPLLQHRLRKTANRSVSSPRESLVGEVGSTR